MDIISAELAVISSFGVFYITCLTLEIIIDWFKKWWSNRNAIPERDRENLAFTIKDDLKNGNYRVIQGVFNRNTEKVVGGEKYETEQLDEELDELHEDNRLVIYN